MNPGGAGRQPAVELERRYYRVESLGRWARCPARCGAFPPPRPPCSASNFLSAAPASRASGPASELATTMVGGEASVPNEEGVTEGDDGLGKGAELLDGGRRARCAPIDDAPSPVRVGLCCVEELARAIGVERGRCFASRGVRGAELVALRLCFRDDLRGGDAERERDRGEKLVVGARGADGAKAADELDARRFPHALGAADEERPDLGRRAYVRAAARALDRATRLSTMRSSPSRGGALRSPWPSRRSRR